MADIIAKIESDNTLTFLTSNHCVQGEHLVSNLIIYDTVARGSNEIPVFNFVLPNGQKTRSYLGTYVGQVSYQSGTYYSYKVQLDKIVLFHRDAMTSTSLHFTFSKVNEVSNTIYNTVANQLYVDSAVVMAMSVSAIDDTEYIELSTKIANIENMTASASASTGSAGSSASASITKTVVSDIPNFAFSFSIPRGDTGYTGLEYKITASEYLLAEPSLNDEINLTKSNFNRTPIANEPIFLPMRVNNTIKCLMLGGTIKSTYVDAEQVPIVISFVYDLKGLKGDTGNALSCNKTISAYPVVAGQHIVENSFLTGNFSVNDTATLYFLYNNVYSCALSKVIAKGESSTTFEIIESAKTIVDTSTYVQKTTKVNGHALSGDITITKANVGLGSVPNTDCTNASNISSGTLNENRLPSAISVSKGGTGRSSLTSGYALIGNGTGGINTKQISTSVSSGSTNLITSGAVYTYVSNAIAGIKTITLEVVSELPTADATKEFITSKKIYLVRNQNPSGQDLYFEYICVGTTSGGTTTYSWERLGNDAIDLSGYVQKTTTIAGIDLQDNITESELKSALEVPTEFVMSASVSGDVLTLTDQDGNVITFTGGGGGGLTEVKAENVNSESATSGQVLCADGNGGASWQNQSGGGASSIYFTLDSGYIAVNYP